MYQTDGVRLSGLDGRWYLSDSYTDEYGNEYYLWESENHWEDYGAVLTDEFLTIIDYCCESGILTALVDNGIIEQEERSSWEDLLLLAGLEY